MTLDTIKAGADRELIVLVDTDTSRENVSRAAASQGYGVSSVDPDGDGYRLTLKKE
jgi:TusA-related sulfurtransferase